MSTDTPTERDNLMSMGKVAGGCGGGECGCGGEGADRSRVTIEPTEVANAKLAQGKPTS